MKTTEQHEMASACPIITDTETETIANNYSLPNGWWLGTKLNANGLSERSSGNGNTRSTVIHILTDNIRESRFTYRRVATPLCGYKSKGWAGDDYRPHDGLIPTCRACVKKFHAKTKKQQQQSTSLAIVDSSNLSNAITVPGMLLTEKGAVITAASDNQLLDAAQCIKCAQEKWDYYQADLLIYAREKNPELAVKIAEALGMNYTTTRKAVAIGKVPQALRRLELHPAHHWIVGRFDMTGEQQAKWLEVAVENNLTAGELHRSILLGHVVERKKSKGAFKSPFSVKLTFQQWLRGLGSDGFRKLSKPALESVLSDLGPIVETYSAIKDYLTQGEIIELD